MQIRMLLLVPAVGLLVGPAIANCTPAPRTLNHNLNSVLDLARKYNESFTKEVFVEDVSHLAEGHNKCHDTFFCKVYQILSEHEDFGKRKKDGDKNKDEDALVSNLRIYTEDKNRNCSELLKHVKASHVSKPIPDLLGYLTHCIKSRNFNH